MLVEQRKVPLSGRCIEPSYISCEQWLPVLSCAMSRRSEAFYSKCRSALHLHCNNMIIRCGLLLQTSHSYSYCHTLSHISHPKQQQGREPSLRVLQLSHGLIDNLGHFGSKLPQHRVLVCRHMSRDSGTSTRVRRTLSIKRR